MHKVNSEAINESKVEAEQLLKEILPLIEECFEGEITCDSGAIIYSMPNGQKFYITARAA